MLLYVQSVYIPVDSSPKKNSTPIILLMIKRAACLNDKESSMFATPLKVSARVHDNYLNSRGHWYIGTYKWLFEL